MAATEFTSPPSGAGVAAALAQVEAGLAQLSELLEAGALGELADSAAAELTLRLSAAAERTAAVQATCLHRVHSSGWARGEGYLTTTAWLAAQTRSDTDRARDRVLLAGRLTEHYPQVAVAWSAGEITSEHSRILTCGLDNIMVKLSAAWQLQAQEAGGYLSPAELREMVTTAREELLPEFLELARKQCPRTLTRSLRKAAQLIDPDGATRAQIKALTDSTVTFTDVGDMTLIKAYVTHEVAAMLRTTLDHFRDTRYRAGADGAEGAGAAGAGAACAPATEASEASEIDPVTGQRVRVRGATLDAIAFGDWIAATLDGGLGTGKVTERPHVDVTMSLSELQDAASTPAGAALLARLQVTVPTGTGQFLACDPNLRVVRTVDQVEDLPPPAPPPNASGVAPDRAHQLRVALARAHREAGGIPVLDYGRAVRIVPNRLRRALAHRDGGCAFPHCQRPPAHTQAHHVQHWAHGGATSLANTVLLCSRHHQYVHLAGWVITPTAGTTYTQTGCWTFTAPPLSQRKPPPSAAPPW